MTRMLNRQSSSTSLATRLRTCQIVVAVAVFFCLAQFATAQTFSPVMEPIMESQQQENGEPQSGNLFFDDSRETAWTTLPLSISPDERSPEDDAAPTGYYEGQPGFEQTPAPKQLQWSTPEVNHRRLFFEEPLLERHGLTINEPAQPLISGGRFLYRSAVFPLDIIKGYHRRCENGSGWGAPGSYPGRQR